MLLFLVRHALTPITGKRLTGWLPGISLSEEGRKQAEEVGQRLSGVKFDAIYSSPLERCVETAEAIAVHQSAKIDTVEGLGEIKYGDWQGKTFVTLYKSRGWKELKARPADFRFPNGETIREAQVRGMTEIERLRSKHKNSTILVCSHADMIRVLTAGYLGLSLDLYDRIAIAPTSTTVLLLGEGVPRLLKLGDSGTYDEVIARLPKSARKSPTKAR